MALIPQPYKKTLLSSTSLTAVAGVLVPDIPTTHPDFEAAFEELNPQIIPALIAIGSGALFGALSAGVSVLGGGAFFGLTGGLAILAGAGVGAALGAASFGLQRLLAPDPVVPGEVRRTVRIATGPARHIVGEMRAGGQLVAWFRRRTIPTTAKATGETRHHWVIAYSMGACEGIKGLWIDGERIPLATPVSVDNGRMVFLEPVADSEYSADIGIFDFPTAEGWYEHRNPVENNFFQRLDVATGGAWGTANRLEGIAFAHVILRNPHLPFQSARESSPFAAPPQLEFLIKGRKLTWPGQATPAWTDNAAAIRYWYMTELQGVEPSLIDGAQFKRAFDRCAEKPTGYINARYTANGLIQSTDDPVAISQELDEAWQGYAVLFNGSYYFWAGTDDVPVYAITEDDIVGTSPINVARPLQERFSGCELTLAQDSNNHYLESALPPLEDAGLKALNGETRILDMGTRRFVSDGVSGRHHQAIQLRRMKPGVTVRYTLTPDDAGKLYALRPAQFVSVTDPKIGWTTQRCFVLEKTFSADGTIGVTLESVGSNVWADETYIAPTPPRPLPVQRRNYVPPAPTGLDVRTRVRWSAGEVNAAINVSWGPENTEYLQFFCRGVDYFDRQITAPDGDDIQFRVRNAGRYTVTANQITPQDVQGPSTTREVEVTFATLAPVGVITLIRLDNPDSQAVMSLRGFGRDPAVQGIQLAYLRVDISDGAELPSVVEGWDALTFWATIPVSEAEHELNRVEAQYAVPEDGRYRIWARSVNSLGLTGPISPLGEHILRAQPIGFGRVNEEVNLGLGTFQWTGFWGDLNKDGEQDVLVYSPDYRTRTFADFNGRNGWPFGGVPEGPFFDVSRTANYVRQNALSGGANTRVFWVVSGTQIPGFADWFVTPPDPINNLRISLVRGTKRVQLTVLGGAGQEFKPQVERDLILTLSYTDAADKTTEVTFLGPNHPGTKTKDETEPYSWAPSNDDDVIRFLDAYPVAGGESITARFEKTGAVAGLNAAVYTTPVLELDETRIVSVRYDLRPFSPPFPQVPLRAPHRVEVKGSLAGGGEWEHIQRNRWYLLGRIQILQFRILFLEGWNGFGIRDIAFFWDGELARVHGDTQVIDLHAQMAKGSGIFSNVAMLNSFDESILVREPSKPLSQLTFGELNGQSGWPFGK